MTDSKTIIDGGTVEVGVAVDSTAVDDALDKVEALGEATADLAPMVSIRNCRGCTFNIYTCPFCGGEADPFNPFGNVKGYWMVLCGSCGASNGFCDTEAEAIVAWNTRAEQTCKLIERSSLANWPDMVCWSCSVCDFGWHHSRNDKQFSFCPNCGAKVNGVDRFNDKLAPENVVTSDDVCSNTAFMDSRAKIEEDIADWLGSWTAFSVPISKVKQAVFEWLDRQAAIAKHEQQAEVDAKNYCIENIMETLHDTQAQLQAGNQEREHWRNVCGKLIDKTHEMQSIYDEGLA